MTTTTSANDTTHWTAASWRAHVADFHPSHAAASYALHREEMGRLGPSARVITALTMVGKRLTRLDPEPLGYENALRVIESACVHRLAMPRKGSGPALATCPPPPRPAATWTQTTLPLAVG